MTSSDTPASSAQSAEYDRWNIGWSVANPIEELVGRVSNVPESSTSSASNLLRGVKDPFSSSGSQVIGSSAPLEFLWYL